MCHCLFVILSEGKIAMLKYILKRILLAIPIFLGVTFLVYILSSLTPGSPIDIMIQSGNLTEEAYEALKQSLGLDKPIIVRYFIWLGDFFRGNLGISSASSQAVARIIAQRIQPTLILALSSLLLSLVIGIPLGILSAYKPYSFWDTISSGISFLGTSTPNFLISLLFIYLFSVTLGVLPSQGMYSVNKEHTIVNLLLHLILPAFVVALHLVGNFIKQTRSSMLEVLNEEYIKTARAKGIAKRKVIIDHVLRNAWIPIVTAIGMSIPYLIGGTVVVEQIFSWPGLGSLMISSINSRDYNIIMGITVIICVAVLVTNILMDIIYALLDPRIATGLQKKTSEQAG